MPDFVADVDEWVAKAENRLDMVVKESTQRVFSVMLTPVGSGGNLPVDTGFLRASFIATLNAPVENVIFKAEEGGSYGLNSGPIALVINGASPGTTIYGVFTASYARYVEYGTNGRPGRAFVRLAAQQWPTIVQQVVTEAQARFP